MKEEPDLNSFYPDIKEYVDDSLNSFSVTTNGLEELIIRIQARTGLNKTTAEAITKYFFQEIRNALVRREDVLFYNFISFRHSNKIRRFFIKTNKTFLEKLNEK